MVIGEYVELEGTTYVVVMIGSKCYGVVTLQSRACSEGIILIVEQEFISIVSPERRKTLIALYGHPNDLDEFYIGNILTEELVMHVGDYFKIDMPRQNDLEIIYEAVVVNSNWVSAKVVYPSHLAEKLRSEGVFKICTTSLDLIVLGNPSNNEVLRAIYG